MKRVLYDIFLVLSVFLLPWWTTAVFAILGFFLFKDFYEFLFIFAFMYVVYGYKGSRVFTSPFYFSLFFIVLFFVLSFIRKQIIFYRNQ